MNNKHEKEKLCSNYAKKNIKKQKFLNFYFVFLCFLRENTDLLYFLNDFYFDLHKEK